MYRTCAPAKVNLDLRVGPRRPDGYHDLDTVFQSIALADTLRLEPADGPFTLVCETPGVPTDASNLAWKGAQAVATAMGRSLDGWRVRLDKRVPAEAGLGGGSADAAAAARLLLAAWHITWTPEWLADTLAPVGADVAYFALGGTVRGRGRGDRLERLPDEPARPVLIVRPPVGVSTREAYGWFDAWAEAPGGPMAGLAGGTLDGVLDGALDGARNDLQPPVVARVPLVGQAVERCRAAGARLALMSGSGSAVFGVFDEEAVARAAATGWPADWGVWLTHTVDGAMYRRLTAVEVPTQRSPLSEPQPVV